jgi:small subunit ribosomal protein S20
LAQHKSAKKRARQNLQRRARNRGIRSRLKTAIKYARAAIAGTDGADASDAVRKAEREIRKAASKGVLSKKQASRRVSRLARSVKATS